MGKTENADRMLTKHFGQQLQVNKRKPKFFVSLDWFVCVGNVKHCCRNENGSHPNLGFCICICIFLRSETSLTTTICTFKQSKINQTVN